MALRLEKLLGTRTLREYQAPILLGLACTLLGLAVFGEYWYKSASQDVLWDSISSNPTGGTAAETAARKSFELPPAERFQSIVDRPLFVQGRRSLSQSDDVQAEPETPLELQLHGSVMSPDGLMALVKDKAGHNYRLHEGERMEGWTLTEIRPDRVTMVRGDTKKELLLQKPKSKEQPAEHNEATGEPPPNDKEVMEDIQRRQAERRR